MRIGVAVQTLVDAGVEFVLIGGWAAIFNGAARTTSVLELCYARTPDLQALPELESLLETLDN